jgi:serine protease AprX
LLAALFVLPSGPSVTATTPNVDPALASQAAAHPSRAFSVIVREQAPASAAAEGLVRSLGGRVSHELPIVGSFSATVPGAAVRALAASDLVRRVWGDGRLHMQSVDMSAYDVAPTNSVWKKVVRLPPANAAYTGAGVGVAVLDTGVVPVPDLVGGIRQVVDLTPEDNGLDGYGHGTAMAGIIGGRGLENGADAGVAPRANVISIKVAGFNGATDVSVVIAGLQWAVTHRAQYNIRVLNLSFGTDSRQPYAIDPLDYAVERAWRAGILVVVSAGNRGSGRRTITKPGDDPFVVTVGAADLRNTISKSDDVVAPFSSRGPTQDGFAKPDLVAPGVTIVTTRDPGSVVDLGHPDARVGSSYIKGSGTSEAAAVVSGVAALMYQANPRLTPNVAKGILIRTARRYGDMTGLPGAGAGNVDADGATRAATTMTTVANGGLVRSRGTGSLEASRGSGHVYVARCDPSGTCTPVLLTGEVDALGNPWSADALSTTWSANPWSGYTYAGSAWSGAGWSANSWAAHSWSGMQWDANSWSANSWSKGSWDANSWSGNTWSGTSWSGNTWSANSWSANSWSANSWS